VKRQAAGESQLATMIDTRLISCATQAHHFFTVTSYDPKVRKACYLIEIDALPSAAVSGFSPALGFTGNNDVHPGNGIPLQGSIIEAWESP